MKTNSLTEKLIQAKAIYAEGEGFETLFFQTLNEMLVRGWKLGQILSELKEAVGHGRWLLWLEGNWPELGERKSQRCIAFFKTDESWKMDKSVKFYGFHIDAVRKFSGGYVPAKERLQLEGDEGIKPGPHHLTFVNQFSKYDRQLRNGHVEGFSPEIFKREIEPMLRRIVELCGRDWILSLL